MTQRVFGRVIVAVVGIGAFGYLMGYAARLPQLRVLNTDQQAWAVFALGLIAAVVLLFRAAQAGDVSR